MRKEAAKRDLAPDKWFNNVEIVRAEKVRHRNHHLRA
jgi:hypothetical protein